MWCSSKENEAGASFAGCVEARSVHVEVRAKPWAPAPGPGRDGESSGLPNQGKHRGTPPRIAFVPSKTAREDSHRTSSSSVGRHDRRWAPKGVICVEEEGTVAERVAISLIVISEVHG